MFYFLLAFLIAVILTVGVRQLAWRFGAIDNPDAVRKLHGRSVPLWGGAAIFITFWLLVGYLAFFTNILDKHFSGDKLIGVFLGSLIILLMGLYEDRQRLSPAWRLFFTILAALAVVVGGVHLDGITNPLGGILPLDVWQFNLFFLGKFFVLGDLLVFFWLMGMMFSTKILDGLDGLSTGVATIGAGMIFLLTTVTRFHQGDTALVALIFIGVCLGFLVFNFYPAKIFLGESGSLLIGFILGVLSIIAGGKIATTLLVMGMPILDLVLVVWRRYRRGQNIFLGDRTHLHFRLVDSGLKQWQAILVYYCFALLFGMATFLPHSGWKILALIILILCFVFLENSVEKIRQKKYEKK